MELTEEIKAAARQLGQSLRQENWVRAYLNALEEARSDPETSALEQKMYEVYEALIIRQQAGEILDQEDTRPFYELREQVHDHPLIARRNGMLRLAKPYLAEVADEISFPLGMDYAALAR